MIAGHFTRQMPPGGAYESSSRHDTSQDAYAIIRQLRCPAIRREEDDYDESIHSHAARRRTRYRRGGIQVCCTESDIGHMERGEKRRLHSYRAMPELYVAASAFAFQPSRRLRLPPPFYSVSDKEKSPSFQSCTEVSRHRCFDKERHTCFDERYIEGSRRFATPPARIHAKEYGESRSRAKIIARKILEMR